MARNLYDMGDRRPRQNDSWLQDRQESRSRILPVGMLLLALAIGGGGFLMLQKALPASVSKFNSNGPMTISDMFSACDDAEGAACVLSANSYAYRGRSYHLSDISVPSLASPQCATEAAQATRGRAALVSMMNGGSFEARPDPADASPSARILMRDGISLGQLMILKNYARPWSGKTIDWCAG